MFIKILTPNHNGKIELTVRDLEALIKEAVDKAISEKCSGCYKNNGWYYSSTTPYINLNCDSVNGTVTNGLPSEKLSTDIIYGATATIATDIPTVTAYNCPNTISSNISTLIGEKK
jgi:hypothetical protein